MATKTSKMVSLLLSLFIVLLFVSSQVEVADAIDLHLGLERKLLRTKPSNSNPDHQYHQPPTVKPKPKPRPPAPKFSAPPPPRVISAKPPLQMSYPLSPLLPHVPLRLPHASSPLSI
ncbi:hypothetical protein CARUB_v10028271mg [Capsella rubella]|uniref:Uncharacterized protein n=1 Tax=Capsella rubella TaxID=81985 RepID=R0GUT3_9BRAS|nr:hypothetical protein CARUB_v10028271mg [Capsella rubella]